MSWATVAGKEFRDAIRSRRLWLLTAVFVFIFNLPVILWAYFNAGPASPAVTEQTAITSAYVKQMMNINWVFVPLIAILVGYGMIVGELASGSVKLLLALPHSRRDVFFGKIVGRTGVFGAAIAAAYLLALPLLYGTGQPVDLFTWGIFGALTVAFGLVFFAVAAGFSAGADSTLKAGAGAFGLYVWFGLFWDPVTTIVRGVSKSFGLSSREFLEFWFFVEGLSPLKAYRKLTFILRGESQQTVVESAYATNNWGGWPPFYIESWYQLLLLLLWAAIPALIGLYLFERRDL